MHPSTAPLDAPGAAMRHYVAAELAIACQALARRGSRIHAGVHDARKAIRRARAALALGEATLGSGSRVIDRQLRRVNRSLSVLRDAQALVETLDRIAGKPREAAVARLLNRARRIAAARRAAIARDPRQMAVLVDAASLATMLAAAVQGLAWDGLSASAIADALAAASHRSASAAARACAAGSHDDDWHRWRRRLRRMSQQRRACIAAGLEHRDAMFDKDLAEQLGKLQDLTLLADRCGRGSPFAKPDRVTLREFAEAALTHQRARIASVVAPTQADATG